MDGSGEPLRSTVSSTGLYNTSNGHAYDLTAHLFVLPGNAPHCLWQVKSGQGGQSHYGLFNMVGGFHHYLSNGSMAGGLVLRPQNQIQDGAAGQLRSWRDDTLDPTAFYASPSFHLVIKGDECGNVAACDIIETHSIVCNDNGTPSENDDYFVLTVNGTVSDGSGSYRVSIDGTLLSGTTASGVSRVITGNGVGSNPLLSADGTNYSVVLQDASDSNCSVQFNASETACSVPECSIAVDNYDIQCFDNSTSATDDDYFSINITGTISNGSENYIVRVDGTQYGPATPSGSSFLITGDGAGANPLLLSDGSTSYLIRVEDATDSNCFVEFTSGPVSPCSNCPTPNCATATAVRNN